MPDLNKTLEVVSAFLVRQGYGQQKPLPGVKAGDWLYEWCQNTMQGGICPCNVKASLLHLFTMLENGSYVNGLPHEHSDSAWTRVMTNAALAAGGFPLWEE